jgi:phenylalanyl-tRNA synthetase beta chain
MKVSVAWLKEYVNLPFSATVNELAEKLTFAGLEIEEVRELNKGFEKIVVGQILERKQHPNADRLSLTTIDVGGAEKLQIVCGAQNIKAGQKIPVAMIGAKIPNGLEIKAAEIRKVPSQGMLCSLDELLLPKEWQKEDGIFLLPENAKLGTPLADLLLRNDAVLEVNVTPNRGDALSHFGVARDLAALYGVQAKLPEIKVNEVAGGIAASVNILEKELCPQYLGRVIEGVKIAPSPDWLKAKLENVGLRSINNVVDVTAFVMLEMGQPLHAFDANKLMGSAKEISISVRKSKAKEAFTTLADKAVELEEGDLLIASGAEKIGVALAGVMGGKNSEVDDRTTNIFLEAAEFHPVRVRKTGRRLNLLTDAGYRFERGVDSGRIEWALDRATQLIQQLAGGTARKKVGTPNADVLPQVRLRLSEIERLLGKSPDSQKVIQILRGLGISAEPAAGEKDVISVQIPKWRKDLKRSVDLIEEIARIWGFDQLDSKLPLNGLEEGEQKDSRRRSYFQVRRVRRHLASLGFMEVLNYGFTSKELLQKAHEENDLQGLVEVANPVTSDYSVMKPSLLTGMLENAKLNFAHNQKDLRLFELRRVFSASAGKEEPRVETHVKEELRLALLLTGAEVDEFWQGKPMPVDFYSLKGALESVFEMLGLGGLQFQAGSKGSHFHPGQSATILVGNRELGTIGRLHPRVEKSFEFEQDVFFAEIKMDGLVSDERKSSLFKPFSNYPQVERDFSAQVADSVSAQSIKNLVTKVAKPLMREFRFFDVYKGSRVPEGHVSYAFRVILGSNDHTLTDAEISSVQEKIMKEMQKEFQAKFAGLS